MAKKRGNGEGSITKRKDGSWMGRVTIGRKSDGNLDRKCVYGRTRAEVSEKITKLLNEVNSGTYIEPTKMTTGEWLDIWFMEYVLTTKRPSTSKGYDDIIKLHLKPTVGNIPLKDLSPVHLQSAYNEKLKDKKLEDGTIKKGLSARTIEHINVMLGTALNQAIKCGYTTKNVSKLVAKPKVEQAEIQYLSLEEQRKLLSILNTHRLGFAYEFDMATGLRQSELLGIRWKDFNEEKGSITIRHTIMRQRNYDDDESKTKIVKGKPKTKKGIREIPLAPSILKKLKMHRENQEKYKLEYEAVWKDSGLIFTSEIGTNIEPRRLLDTYHKLLAKLGLKKRGIHTLRHTFATRAIENGMDVKTLSEILGHEDVSTTLNLYVHSSDEVKKESMNKMDYLFT
jgi:integrase